MGGVFFYGLGLLEQESLAVIECGVGNGLESDRVLWALGSSAGHRKGNEFRNRQL